MKKELLKLYTELREKGIIKLKPEYEEIINKSQKQKEHTKQYQEWKNNMGQEERKVFEEVYE